MSEGSRPARILHIVQSLGTGGLENGVVNLANGIDRNRFELDILCLRYVGELRRRLSLATNVLFAKGMTSTIPGATRAIRQHCRKRSYDLVHTHGWATLLPGYLGARAAGRVRVINGEHGTFFTDAARQRLVQRLLFRLVDANCTVSESLRDEMGLRFGVPASLVSPIANGVDIERFCPNEAERTACRAALGVAPGEVLFGAVGRLVPVKDYGTLIAAFRMLLNNCGSARMILVGDGPDMASLRQAAGDLERRNRIVLTGNRDDVPSLMNAMDVFCLTSVREGLSNTLLEAQASGLPVIATDTGGNSEAIASDETGYLVAVGDETGLAERMTSLATQPKLREQLGSAARKRAVGKFSIIGMVRAYEELYERVLRG